jgi:hypothetical protein
MDYEGNTQHVPRVDLLSAGFSGPTSSNFDCRAGLGVHDRSRPEGLLPFELLASRVRLVFRSPFVCPQVLL